jgi:hypothetical protein
MTTEFAAVRLEEPAESSLRGVSNTYTSEVDRSTVRTLCEAHGFTRLLSLD